MLYQGYGTKVHFYMM